MLRSMCVLLLLTGGLAAPAAAQRPDGLHIEAGAHLQRVENLFADRARHLLVSTSTEGTMRIWDAATGALRRTDMLLLPQKGSIQKAGLSRDGMMLAVGMTAGGEFLCLYDVVRGEAVLVQEMPDRVTAVSFSPDGTTVAVALGEHVVVYALPSLRQPGLRMLFEAGFRDVVWALDYDQTGRLAAGSFAGEIRLFDRAGRRVADTHAQAGDEITDLRFSPDGTMLAAGFNSGRGSEILGTAGLATLQVLSPPRAVDGFTEYARVAWSADGATLLTSASTQDPRAIQQVSAVYAWTVANPGSPPRLVDRVRKSLVNLVPLDGAGGDGAGIAFWDGEIRSVRAGAVRWRTPDAKLPFEQADPLDLLVSDDGSVVAFRGSAMPRPFQLDLPAGRLERLAGDAPLNRPAHDVPGLSVTDPFDSRAIRIGGSHPSLERWETINAWALEPAGRGAVLASRFAIRWFDAVGGSMWSAHPGTETWAVTVSRDGRFVVGAMGDGTLRWFDSGTGAPVLSAFVHANGEDWIAWTPDGRFTGPARSVPLLRPFRASGLQPMPAPYDTAAFRQGFETPDLGRAVFGGAR